ncbi:response regulator transcription factor [Reyranella sp.]|uniref:response regulator transcription factor n=1 Tax=Reyranella sp. TaxID=1929291 RepID=UPI003BA9AEAC
MCGDAEIVLVVDDDAAVRAALKFALEVEGFRVRLYDGPHAVLADDRLPTHGCLVVDYRMPGIDGIELVESLRGRGVVLPAILISGRVTRQLRALALRSGMTDVVEKPLSDAALVECIRRALGSL